MDTVMSDSDALIDAMRGREPQRSTLMQLIGEGDLVTSTVTVFELEVGVRSARGRRELSEWLRYVTILDFDEGAARAAGEVYRTLASVGLKIERPDAMIAGIAISNGVPLLTRNVRHFERVPGLRVITL